MGSKMKRGDGRGLSRRDFLKVSAAGAAGAASMTGFDWSMAEPAFATTGLDPSTYDTFHTTCPYCSAQCGQIVAVAKATTGNGYAAGDIIDIWGDIDSPINKGGLCAKGAGSHQLATNPARIGAWNWSTISGAPSYFKKAKQVLCADAPGSDATGIAWKRLGNAEWEPMGLQAAFDEIATALTGIRGAVTPGVTEDSNKKTVQFFGCSHMNNEPNYLYRKLIANFGTSCVEHQARI